MSHRSLFLIPIISLILFSANIGCKNKTQQMNGYLQKNESVAHMAANGEALAIAIRYRPDFGKGLGLPKLEGGVVLIRPGKSPVRTPLQVGAMRSIVAAPSGFVAARVVDDKDLNSTTYISWINFDGKIDELPPLGIDLVGLWVNESGAIYAYSATDVFRWIKTDPIWKRLALDPAVHSEAIRKIVTLKDGSSLVVTDYSIKGFKNIQDPPLFVEDLHTYPESIDAYGDNHWWIVTRKGNIQKISLVGKDGEINKVDSPHVKLIKHIMFDKNKSIIICAGENGSFHDSSYYVLNRDGSGPLRGSFELPSDTIEMCLWGDSIVSGGASNHIYKTEIAR